MGVAHAGYHDFEGDLDYFAFDAPARGVVRLQVESRVGFPLRVQMLGRDCFGMAPNRPRLLVGDEHDRLFYVETPGRQVVRVGGRETGTSFSVTAHFEPRPTITTAELEAWGDAPDVCASRLGLGATTEPPPEEDDIDISQIALPGGLGATTEPPPEEDDIDISQVSWPDENGVRALPVLGPASYVRLTGDFDGLADEDVVWVRVAEPGVLEVEATGAGVAASLFGGSDCSPATRMVSDAAIGSEPLRHVVAAGDYQLRLASNSMADGRYQLAVRLVPVPGR